MALVVGLGASGMLISGLALRAGMGRIGEIRGLAVGGGRLLGRDRHRRDGDPFFYVREDFVNRSVCEETNIWTNEWDQ